jgi:hypothetical protein
VIEIAQRNLVTIYGMSTVSFGFTNEGDDNLQRLTSETGGRVEYPLNNLYSDVDGYLSHPSDDGNYALTVGSGGYASEVSSGIFRAIAAIIGRGDHAVHSALRAGHRSRGCQAVPQDQGLWCRSCRPPRCGSGRDIIRLRRETEPPMGRSRR